MNGDTQIGIKSLLPRGLIGEVSYASFSLDKIKTALGVYPDATIAQCQGNDDLQGLLCLLDDISYLAAAIKSDVLRRELR